jgi:hypothetical protein
MIPRRIASNMLFTSYMVERDYLCANISRMSCGFMPPSVISEARQQLRNINILLEEMVKIKDNKWDDLVPYSREDIEKKMKQLE